jgi:hypothetical protein
MRSLCKPLVLAGLLACAASTEARAEVRVELNAVENGGGRCRTSFLIQNETDLMLDVLRLDVVILDSQQVMRRRMALDLGPVRRAKTTVKTFEIEGECGQIGAVLVNEVIACMPAKAEDCLDALTLSSRVPSTKLFK